MLQRENFTALTVLAILVCVAGCGAPIPATSPTKVNPYAEVFPKQSVDHLGLLMLSDLTPPDVHRVSHEAVLNGDGAEEVDYLLKFTKNNPDDSWAYLLLVHAADSSGRLSEITKELDTRASKLYWPPGASDDLVPKTDNLNIASGYAKIMLSGRPNIQSDENYGLITERLRGWKATDRVSIMMLSSVLWKFDGADVLRAPAVEFLEDDPDFYQLRTFLARAYAHGAGPIHRGDGTIIPGTGYDGDIVELQKHITQVIEEHPDYIPAYFAAVAGASEEDAAKYIDIYLSKAEPGTDWYKRAEKYKREVIGK